MTETRKSDLGNDKLNVYSSAEKAFEQFHPNINPTNALSQDKSKDDTLKGLQFSATGEAFRILNTEIDNAAMDSKKQ